MLGGGHRDGRECECGCGTVIHKAALGSGNGARTDEAAKCAGLGIT